MSKTPRSIRIVRIVLTIVGSIGGAIGLAGMGEDLEILRGWLNWLIAFGTNNRWVLFIAGVVIAIGANVVPTRAYLWLGMLARHLVGADKPTPPADEEPEEEIIIERPSISSIRPSTVLPKVPAELPCGLYDESAAERAFEEQKRASAKKPDEPKTSERELYLTALAECMSDGRGKVADVVTDDQSTLYSKRRAVMRWAVKVEALLSPYEWSVAREFASPEKSLYEGCSGEDAAAFLVSRMEILEDTEVRIQHTSDQVFDEYLVKCRQ